MRRVLITLVAMFAAVLASVATVPASAPAAPDAAVLTKSELPTHIDGGTWPTSHLQGVTVDTENGYMYWSFTQMLVKTNLEGHVIGTVEGLTGHLGDLDFNQKDGRVYGSLEYKDEKAFYIAIFDVDKINRVGMDAERDKVMTTVHLDEVVDDFTADMDGNGVFDGDVADTPDHRYGCSGIDGVSFGPKFGKSGGKQYLSVAYGIYSNTERRDNDNQVILQYDTSNWRRYERPLSQDDPHRSGPKDYAGKYFAYTGNTTYGVQSLDYDGHTGDWMMAVYPGEKKKFPNYSLFIVDGSRTPKQGPIKGQSDPERGQLLSLRAEGLYDPASGTYGWESAGEYGIASLDNGRYYIGDTQEVEIGGETKLHGEVNLNRWTGDAPTPFTPVKPRG